ncbi:hypothetical protein [Gluconobacter morbifer]|uniref:Pectate lyase superfamily protein domain-containing protein n=1 Tax=Gluconobacter morbifer G707 TaxID=1088869 RepID=G6XKV9_9PROT|nr:hypothetical protein [Gluconobacter morbifer]EHH67554.1 hypothetical protein GMO_21250 [Gluconobacter morbifer G707]
MTDAFKTLPVDYGSSLTRSGLVSALQLAGSQANDGAATQVGLGFASDATTGFVRQSDGTWQWMLSGTAALAFESAEIRAMPSWSPATISILSSLAAELQIEWFYKSADGTDWAPALQRAVTFAATSGLPIALAARQYTLASAVSITTAVTIRGRGFQCSPSPSTGTWFIISGTTFNPFSVSSVTARGAIFRDFAVYQTQPGSGTTNWAPTVYPFVFNVTNTLGEVTFDNIFLCNVYDGINCTGSGRLRFRNVTGQPLHRGIVVDAAYDICRFSGVHFWTYWTSAASVLSWMQANASAVELQRCDGPDFSGGCFFFGYQAGLLLSSSSNGVTNDLTGDIVTDCCLYGVHVTGNGVTFQIGRAYCTGEAIDSTTLATSVAILIEGQNIVGQIGHLKAYQQGLSAISLTNTGVGSIVMIDSIVADHCNQGGKSAPIINAAQIATGEPHQISLSAPVQAISSNGAPVINTDTDAILFTPNTNYLAPTITDGGTYQVPNYDLFLLLQVASGTTALAKYTVTLSGNPTDGTVNTIASQADVTALTLSASQNIINPVTSLKAGVGVTYKYLASSNAWFRIG